MKKVILITTTDLTYDQRLQRIATSLSTRYDVTLLGRQLPQSKPFTTQVSYSPKRIRCWFHRGFLFYAEFNVRVAIFLLFRSFDIVTANDLDTVLGVFFGTVFKKTKRFFDAHEWFTEVPELEERMLTKRCWKWIETLFVARFDVHYTVNNHLSDIFQKKLGTPFEVILNAPIKKERTIRAKSNDRYLLYQGALNAGRGLEALIQAMSSLDISLKIAGEGDLSDALRKQTKELGLESRITFLGYIEPSALEALTENAFIGLNLLEKTSLNYYYSLANKFFDYAHAGIPQICMDFPAYRQINREYEVAVLLHALEPEQIKEHIEMLINDTERYCHLKEQTKSFSKQYRWEHEEEKLFALYHSVE